MPKFANLPFDAKLNTIIHELYHISPDFNGDIRRFPGPKYAHGYSLKKYAERVVSLKKRYIALSDGDRPTGFLEMDLEQLEMEYGRVVASRIKQPRPVLISKR
jgi:predicted metallopeptidase